MNTQQITWHSPRSMTMLQIPVGSLVTTPHGFLPLPQTRNIVPDIPLQTMKGNLVERWCHKWYVFNWIAPRDLNEINRKWQDYVYIQCEYKSTKQKIKHLLREENKVKENKIS